MDQVTITTPAKINLGMDVVSQRKDGYHELDMVMQSISLFDTVQLEKKDEPGVELAMDMSRLPTGRRNLAYRAAELFLETYAIQEGVRIQVVKEIPVAAGLGGGSADAAAVLSGLNALFSVGASQKKLRDLGLLIGADVPFCIVQGTARARGVGEKLTKLPALPECAFLIAKPPYGISTKDAYDAFDSLADQPRTDLTALLEGIRKRDLETIGRSLGNSLEAAILPGHADLREMIVAFREAGALGSGMSGSGPSVFGLFRSIEEACRCEEIFRKKYPICQLMAVAPYAPADA